MAWFGVLRRGRVACWPGMAVLLVSLGCSDSTGADQECLNVTSSDGSLTARLHVVNVSNEDLLVVSASVGGFTCGPTDLPVSSSGGIELLQMLLPAGVGDVITVSAGQGSPAGGTVRCQVRPDAPIGSSRLQLFVDLTFPPTTMTCEEGLDPAP